MCYPFSVRVKDTMKALHLRLHGITCQNTRYLPLQQGLIWQYPEYPSIVPSHIVLIAFSWCFYNVRDDIHYS